MSNNLQYKNELKKSPTHTHTLIHTELSACPGTCVRKISISWPRFVYGLKAFSVPFRPIIS